MAAFVLPDVLASDLRVIFCGTAPSRISAQRAAYYANPHNKFWRTLFTVGILPVPLTAQQYPEVLRYGVGLTDLAKHTYGVDSALKPQDFDRQAFFDKIRRYRPRCVAFTSKKAAAVYWGVPTARVSYGLQAAMLGESAVFVLPSPSGLATSYWDESVWRALGAWLQAHAT